MEAVNRYRSLILAYLEEQASYRPSHGNIAPMAIVDEAHDQYLLLHSGWTEAGRVHSVILHVRIEGSKIWIEHDGTPPPGIATYLVEAGVPPAAIVLGFYHPNKRPDTAFAVA
jgi:hypothetical protein